MQHIKYSTVVFFLSKHLGLHKQHVERMWTKEFREKEGDETETEELPISAKSWNNCWCIGNKLLSFQANMLGLSWRVVKNLQDM